MDEFTKQSRKYYKKLSKECASIIDESDLLSCTIPDSGFYLFIDIRKTKLDDMIFCQRLLNEYKTAITPGGSFGYEGFVRASICGNIKEVKKGLRQMVLFVNSL